MYKISKIHRNEGSNEAVVYCNDEIYHITTHDLETLGIVENDTADEYTVIALNEASQRLLCIKKAFDYLSYGDLSEKQLRDKLSRKFSKELSFDVAELMVERGYINDSSLAERYTETFYDFKNMVLNKIRNEIYRRGIYKEDIDNALEKYESEDQNERILEFIKKKYDITLLNDIKYRRKVYAGALRAGFNGSDIGDVLRNFESE